ncbi:hypothetical protein M0R72_10570 [Candidatus Pacearchaeota archaeon]|nr:hypothetical protein [Candidatus Pacearchaeota archaeon]
MKVWCVKWHFLSDATQKMVVGWCAVKGNRRPRGAEVYRVETGCNDAITIPSQFALREPTCRKCLEALKKKGN